MSTVIKVEGVFKEYHLGVIDHGMLYKDIQSTLARLRGKPDPNSRLNESASPNAGRFLALRDVSFDVQEGDVVGIIGKNGAGKSTLLKILSRITTPTRGIVRVKGKMATLLEVGTGFHPELTGRENIFLNGAILGMRKHQIKQKFDEIVDFSGVETYIDTPVKRYSSGMYVRLAFAVSAFLEPDILVVDEVLAVGDAEFQKKCLGKIKDASSNDGRTILFVSHSLDAIRRICTRGLLIQDGKIMADGSIQGVINTYKKITQNIQNLADTAISNRLNRTGGQVQIHQVIASNQRGRRTWSFRHGEDVILDVTWKASAKAHGLGIYLALFSTESGTLITNCKYVLHRGILQPGTTGKTSIILSELTLRAKYYRLYVALSDKEFHQYYDVVDENVGLPELEILPYSKDPHLAAGYFDLKFKVTSK